MVVIKILLFIVAILFFILVSVFIAGGIVALILEIKDMLKDMNK